MTLGAIIIMCWAECMFPVLVVIACAWRGEHSVRGRATVLALGILGCVLSPLIIPLIIWILIELAWNRLRKAWS